MIIDILPETQEARRKLEYAKFYNEYTLETKELDAAELILFISNSEIIFKLD